MSRSKEWLYLDHMNKNFLYVYANVLAGKNKTMHLDFRYEADEKIKDPVRDEDRRNNLYYMIWFAYRYVLGCKTLEETEPYQNAETLKRFKVYSHLLNKNLYIGGVSERVYFHKVEDIRMILEILYNRYSMEEQMECYIRNTERRRRATCVKMYNKYMELKNGTYQVKQDDYEALEAAEKAAAESKAIAYENEENMEE